MVKIKINGAWVVEERKIKEGVVQVFHSLLSKTGEWRSSYNGLSIEVLGGEDAAMLEVQFSEEEVFCALLDLSGDKASSLDGFSMAFWQFNWDFLKEEVMEFLRNFMSRADLKDSRSISLVGGLYKLLAKVLANRLKKVVGKVVSSSQNAFVKSRQILDASLIANEAIDLVSKGNDDVSFLVLVNGTPSFSQSSQGLRWRDLFFSYLFLIAMKALSCLLKRAEEVFCPVGGGKEMEVSCLMFANDTLVFYEPSLNQLTYLSWWFEVMSRLRVNLEKSELILVRRVENLEELAQEFGACLSSYLGLPLGAQFKSLAIWNGIEERL
ncbi:hypothetical protein CK203_107101 [Vitis vinifera]|uniref:Reverse transcriptase domain-containing protein n=1 Tax=Vitis vinifera TaxID=29760 RepID=A0A438ETA9_VITVI|nr:hypothetical protein CK203_107101 [Vitis vinifera]